MLKWLLLLLSGCLIGFELAYLAYAFHLNTSGHTGINLFWLKTGILVLSLFPLTTALLGYEKKLSIFAIILIVFSVSTITLLETSEILINYESWLQNGSL